MRRFLEPARQLHPRRVRGAWVLTFALAQLACPRLDDDSVDAGRGVGADRAVIEDASGEDVREVPEAGREVGVDAAACLLEDPFEPNDSPETAVEIAVPSTHDDLVLCGGADWYALAAPPGQTLAVTITFDPGRVDLDLALFDAADATTPLISSTGYGGLERVELAPAAAARALLARVRAYGGASAGERYDLAIELTAIASCDDDDDEPNDVASEATSMMGQALDRVLCPGDSDHYRFLQPRPGAACRLIAFSAAPLDLALRREDSTTPLGTAVRDPASGAARVTFDCAADVAYLVEVSAPDGAAPIAYSLFTLGARPANDRCDGATPLPPGAEVIGSTLDADDDLSFAGGFGSCTGWADRGGDLAYRVSIAAGQTMAARLSSGADLALYLLDDCASRCCWAGADLAPGGAVELVGHLNTTGAPQELYLIVDSFDLTVAGDFTLSVELDPIDGGVDAGQVSACQPDMVDAGLAPEDAGP